MNPFSFYMPFFVKFFKWCQNCINMRYDPKKAIVLGILQGNSQKFDKIQKAANMDPQELNTILEELENDGLITVVEKKGLFGKKIEMQNTPKGSEELEKSIQEADTKWNEMKALYQLKDKKKLEGFMNDNRSFFPMMMFFGVMDMLMFSMMFSMIGSSMGSFVSPNDLPAGVDSGDAGADSGSSGGDTGGGQDYSDPGVGDTGGGFDFDFGI